MIEDPLEAINGTNGTVGDGGAAAAGYAGAGGGGVGRIRINSACVSIGPQAIISPSLSPATTCATAGPLP